MRACTAVFVCLLSFCGAQSSLSVDSNPNIIRSSAEIEGRVTKTQVRCEKDGDCDTRQYCDHRAAQHSACASCQQKRRRCHNDNMCCPGMRCVNDLCTRPKKTVPENNKNRQPPLDNRRKQKGQERDKCVRSRDCGAGLCCTRYLEEKRCQRIPAAGEGCLLPGRSKGPRAVGRCDCGPGLSCRPLSDSYNTHGVCQPSST
ncbi:hypothetical protein COCON_G00160280 [Conger conger]|uniref:Dickkopf N-terminal cysteine-rich domain-containing protein n=1 Tax=Conger conger TaxID=82655 RepID=A0A9Q1DA22_CONCO|nr:dickkopf-related protein 4-like [Conger conger]KAJ8263571.1 hypothetical protein COCON_G00160280 [Conger conger]